MCFFAFEAVTLVITRFDFTRPGKQRFGVFVPLFYDFVNTGATQNVVEMKEH